MSRCKYCGKVFTQAAHKCPKQNTDATKDLFLYDDAGNKYWPAVQKEARDE